MPGATARVRAALEATGLLLLSDPRLPSVVAAVAGGPVRGSWWAHPQGGAIFRASEALTDADDVVVTRLLAGKITFVQRRWWPALLGVATAREPWQLRGLSSAALRVLDAAERGGIQTDAEGHDFPRGVLRTEGRVLELRLLVRSAEVHTASGAHAKHLESWATWGRRVGVSPLPAEEARSLLEEAAVSFGARRALPWQGTTARARASR